MPDSTPTPPPAPTPKRTRSAINQAWLDELTNSEQIVAAAKKPSYAAALATGGIDAGKVTALSTAITGARAHATAATQDTTGKQGVTQTESDLKDSLVALIQNVQKRARQKYDATNPGVLKDYAIGGKYDSSRAILEQTATSILAKLASDTLPGIAAADITDLQAALDGYKNVQGTQTGAQSDATTDRANLEIAMGDIITKRREIQFAADAEWPHTDPSNAGVRTEFQLPPNRVMK